LQKGEEEIEKQRMREGKQTNIYVVKIRGITYNYDYFLFTLSLWDPSWKKCA